MFNIFAILVRNLGLSFLVSPVTHLGKPKPLPAWETQKVICKQVNSLKHEFITAAQFIG